jgi:DNA-binding NarL/FixJ family response regulator
MRETMSVMNDLIWILDSDLQCLSLYQQTLGLQYSVRAFKSMKDFVEASHLNRDVAPRLIIADPGTIDGSLSQFLSAQNNPSVSANASANANNDTGDSDRFTPDVIVISAIDDLDLMRLYLKTGVRDYLLKPIRPNELVAKVERALTAANNREILILRNDLDGVQISDLTFREHQLLTLFLSRPNRRISRDDLYGAIWSKVTVNRKTLDVHLFNLRRKLRPHGYDIFCKDQTFSLQRNANPVASPSGT